MTRKKKTEVKSDAVPTPTKAPVASEEQSNEPAKYVVVRNGFRVSEAEYDTATDSTAISERDYWAKVATTSRDGSKVEIVPFNKKFHRIW
jgi:hypothetical protein